VIEVACQAADSKDRAHASGDGHGGKSPNIELRGPILANNVCGAGYRAPVWVFMLVGTGHCDVYKVEGWG
jgi:hypothetical protein